MNRHFNKHSILGSVIFENKFFIIPFVFFSLIFLSLLGIYGNSSLFLLVNGCHSKPADILFLNLTYLGDGLVAFFLILVFLWVSFREAMTFLLITLFITVVVSIMKAHLFPELIRPVIYFKSTELLHLVPGYKPPYMGSFPSGHTATIFSVTLFLSIHIKSRSVKLLLLLIAFMVGYSRVYLSAHFPGDVVAGAAIGVLITLLCYPFSRQFNSSWLDNKIGQLPNVSVRSSPL